MIILLARAGAFSLALALAACGAARQAPPDAAADKAFKVVTTFLPITLFTRAVAGDCATVTALIPPSLGPHDFQAKPGDLTALRQAGVLVKNGLEMEGFLGKLVAAAENPQLVVIDSSRGVATLESAEHGDGHGHDGVATLPFAMSCDGCFAWSKVENVSRRQSHNEAISKTRSDCHQVGSLVSRSGA